MSKKIELYEGYEVEFNEQLADDFDFIADLAKAEKEQDIPTILSMYFALVGGEDVYDDVKAHIKKEYGYLSTTALTEIATKISDMFPKAGSRASKRSWQTTK